MLRGICHPPTTLFLNRCHFVSEYYLVDPVPSIKRHRLPGYIIIIIYHSHWWFSWILPHYTRCLPRLSRERSQSLAVGPWVRKSPLFIIQTVIIAKIWDLTFNRQIISHGSLRRAPLRGKLLPYNWEHIQSDYQAQWAGLCNRDRRHCGTGTWSLCEITAWLLRPFYRTNIVSWTPNISLEFMDISLSIQLHRASHLTWCGWFVTRSWTTSSVIALPITSTHNSASNLSCRERMMYLLL